MLTVAFIIMFFYGRLVSLLIYQISWSNGASGVFPKAGATASLLCKPWPWLLHLAMLWPLSQISWHTLPALQTFAILVAILLAIGSVGRLGTGDLGHFWLDRALVICLTACVPLSPLFLYLAIIASCALQYTVASWKLGPGYSNLLGFEWIRASACVLIACLSIGGWLNLFSGNFSHIELLTFAVVLAFQASTYVNHALAKSALGSHWYSWIAENRIQCLIVNSWLRGWTMCRNQSSLLKLAALIGRFRILICAIAWSIEMSWILILFSPQLAIYIITVTIALHLVVFIFTGLASYHYLASHIFFLTLLTQIPSFPETLWLASLVVIILYAIWTAIIRTKIFNDYRANKNHRSGPGCLADAADHLMAWWDSPSMRMFCFTVQTSSGTEYFLPTSKLSPHDTSLTDIHTHLMILGIHPDLDPVISRDQKHARTGVWGLVIDRNDRDLLYRMMDQKTDPSRFKTPAHFTPWECFSTHEHPQPARHLHDFFQSISMDKYRRHLLWPHFPGEDLAPDRCPIADLPTQTFSFQEPIFKITLWRIKTWFSGDEISLLERSPVGIIHLQSPTHKP